MSLVLASLGALSLHLVFTAFEREHVRDLFARFVPEQVVDQVLARTDADLRLGGRELVATVMFSDLRGFTTSVETMHADHVIEVLNSYLAEMSDAILAHGGTLVSYMGDGIMAVFGAPIEQPDHADRALAAALEMLDERLPKVNAWLRERNLGEGYKMGIGLNTGPVMSGNVGHTRRLEYTAVGDTVNTASRVEGMTKGTPYSLFVAESTHSLLASPERLEEVGELEVRGRRQTLRIWGAAACGSASPLRAA
jgi:adenylate cyclase